MVFCSFDNVTVELRMNVIHIQSFANNRSKVNNPVAFPSGVDNFQVLAGWGISCMCLVCTFSKAYGLPAGSCLPLTPAAWLTHF